MFITIIMGCGSIMFSGCLCVCAFVTGRKHSLTSWLLMSSFLLANLLFHRWWKVVVTLPPIGERSIVMSVSVCVRLSVCVCLSVHDHVFGNTLPIFTRFVVHATYGRGLVLLWRRSDALYTSGFMDDVINQGCSTSPPSWSAVHMQPWAWS